MLRSRSEMTSEWDYPLEEIRRLPLFTWWTRRISAPSAVEKRMEASLEEARATMAPEDFEELKARRAKDRERRRLRKMRKEQEGVE